MADDLEAPDETGVLGDEPFEDDGADYDSSPPPRLGGGCFFCNHPKGECMSPGDHCPLAKKMFAPKPAPSASELPYVTDVIKARFDPEDEGGVWLVHGHVDVVVQPFPDELSALRSAMANGFQATFVKYGDQI